MEENSGIVNLNVWFEVKVVYLFFRDIEMRVFLFGKSDFKGELGGVVWGEFGYLYCY